MKFDFQKLEIPELILITPKIFSDERGYFFENYKFSEYFSNGITSKFVQDNYSYSSKNVLRGLHYQKPPSTQAKLVSVTHGKIFDVAVDIRKKSPTFGKWSSAILSAENHKLLFIPEGFAHGFCVLSDNANVLYKVSHEYSPDDERGILWNDPEINVSWPVKNPKLHKKDSDLPLLKNADSLFI